MRFDMESFLFALNAVAPIVAMMATGYLLKVLGFMTADFTKRANRLCFKVFLPCMLFLNVYKIEDIGGIEPDYIIYVVAVVLFMFLLSFPVVSLITKDNRRRGVLAQTMYRSNHALIGIPLAQALYGQSGVAVATLVSATIVPLFNVLAVISLSVFRKGRTDFRRILLDIIKNPLIQSIALGFAVLLIRPYTELRLSNIDVIYKPLGYLSGIATPLALLVLGAQFEFSAVKGLRKEIICGTLLRCLCTPLVGLGVAAAFFGSHFDGAYFAAFVSVFTTPLAVSTVSMAQEMDGDSVLAGQLVLWTTLFSALSTFTASFLLKMFDFL